MIILKKYLVVLVGISMLISFPGIAFAGAYKYKIVGNEIILFGKKIKPTIPLKVSKPESEDDTLVDFNASPTKVFVVVNIATVKEDEYFLYSKGDDSLEPLIFDHAPNSIPSWINKDLFSISWGGMDYSFSRIFEANHPDKSFVIENIIEVLDGKYYVSYVDGGVKVGCFIYCGVKPEIFKILGEDGKPISTWVDIDKITRKKDELIVAVSARNGKTIERVVHPSLFK